MKNLRAVTAKMQRAPSNSIYLAGSALGEMEFSEASYVEVKWASQMKEVFHSTFERKEFIQENSNILNGSKECTQTGVEAYGNHLMRKCLFKFEYRYYSIDFLAKEAEFESIKGFLVNQIGSLITNAGLNEKNRLFAFFLEGLNEPANNSAYPKLTIKLVDRYDHNCVPFVNHHQKKYVLKCLARKQVPNNRERRSPQKNSQILLRTENVAMALKEQQPQLDEMPGQRPNKSSQIPKNEIAQGSPKILCSSNDLAIRLNSKQDAEMKQPSRRKGESDSRTRFHSMRESHQSTNLIRVKLFIQEHNEDEEGKWTFKGRKEGETFLLTESELIQQGFEREVQNYKKMLAANKIKQEPKEPDHL